MMDHPILSRLARSINLRDLGGAKTRGGSTVKHGRVFRSAGLSALSPEERAAMRALGIRSIFDLRHNGERANFPTPWEDLGCNHYWFHDHSRAGDLTSFLERLDVARARQLMVDLYRELPYSQAPALKELFQTVTTRDGAVLFHCAAGKDRTGVTAALLLHALDVPHDAILEDYLASTRFAILESPTFRRPKPYTPEQLAALEPIMVVQAEYLDAMFDAIATRDGSVDNYLTKTIGVSGANLDKVRERLLT